MPTLAAFVSSRKTRRSPLTAHRAGRNTNAPTLKPRAGFFPFLPDGLGRIARHRENSRGPARMEQPGLGLVTLREWWKI